MLLAITYRLGEKLKARGVPYPVVPGPLQLGQGSSAESRIVLERDLERGDTVDAPMTFSRNPGFIFARGLGFKIRIWSRSTISGARPMDHQRVADAIADQTMVAMREIAGERRTQIQWGDSGFLTPADLDEPNASSWGGVVYQIRGQIGRGVTDENYQGEAAAEATAGGAHGFGVATADDATGAAGSDLPSATTRE